MSDAGPSRNPYVGPRSLQFGEKIYGRDRETRQLLDLLIAERIVLLYSPSGAGKTSLIQAGLIPGLRQEEFEVLPVIRVSRDAGEGVYPCNQYVMSALLSLERDVPPEKAIPAAELAAMKLCDYLERREAADGTDNGTFLIFDQFEEILTINPMNREAKMDFFNQVGDALRDLKRWALFAMREDHVAALDPYLRPIPTRLKSTFRLDLLTAESARLAVQQPAKDGGVEFTEEATTKLVEDLRQVVVQGPDGEAKSQAGPYVEPVQLQVVCFRLWEKLPAGVTKITGELVVGSSDVDSALADYYAERVAQIATKSGVKERVLREWFDRRLITESGIRGQVMVGSESTKELNEAAIQALVDVHLIRGEERRGVTWLELAHDRLVKPIRANNSAWSKQNLSVLQHAAAVWGNQGRSDALCLRGAAREEARKWAAAHDDELTATEREFLDVCQRNHDARTNKWAAGAVSVLTVVIGCISLLTIYAWRQAADAKKERDVATARSVAARALRLGDDRLDVALLLSTEAQRLCDLPETRGSLLASAYHNPRLTTYLNGSISPISAVAFNHDGSKVVTGDFEGVVQIWDATTHRMVETLPELVQGAVRSIVFSEDGRYMAATSKGRTVVLRDQKTGELTSLPAAFAHEADVWVAAFTSDSRFLATGDRSGRIQVWEIATGKVVKIEVAGEAGKAAAEVRALAFSPAGDALFAGCTDGEIRLWSLRDGAWSPVPRAFSAEHPDDPERDERVRAENVISDARLRDVRCLALSGDGKFLAAGRRSGAVDLYDVSKGEESVRVAAMARHDGSVSSLAFSPLAPAGEHEVMKLITASFDGTLRLWKVPTMEDVGPPFTGHVGRVFCVAFSGDRQSVVSGGADRRAILWNASQHVAQTGRTESAEVTFSIAFSPDGVFEANGYADGTTALWKRSLADWGKSSRVVLRSETVAADRFPILTFSGDSTRLATFSADGKLRVYDLAKAGTDGMPPMIFELEVTTPADAKKVKAMGLSRDGDRVGLGVAENGMAQIFLWKVATREPLFPEPIVNEIDGVMYALEFSPDGRHIATGGDGERAVLWKIDGGAKPTSLAFPEFHTGIIRAIAFSPNGKMLATTSGDNTLILWDTAKGIRLSAPLTGHHAPVVVAAFSPDGRFLASGSDDHSVILWDVATRQATGQLTGHTDSVRALAFSRDSKRLYTGSWGADSCSWELDPEALENKCRDRANRNLSQSEWTDYMLSGPYRQTWPNLPTPPDENTGFQNPSR